MSKQKLSKKLQLACESGDIDTARRMLAKGANANSQDGLTGETALHYASRRGDFDITKCLIMEGHCDVNIKSFYGDTPLHVACKDGHFGIVKSLIMEGHCDVNIRNSSGDTPLHVACLQGRFDIVKWLITEGHYDVNSRNDSGNTVLHLVCKDGHFDIVKWLIITEGHCDVNIWNSCGDTPLHVACLKGHFDIIKWLITEGHCDVNSRNNSGNTALHLVCKQGDFDIVKWLITEGHCNVNIGNNSGYSSLHRACWQGNSNIVKWLITEGHSDVNSRSKNGDTPLHRACWRGHFTVVKWLVTEGKCDVNIRSNFGDTPLRVACKRGCFDVVKWLITEGHCDINIRNNSGDTSLHGACGDGHFNVVKCLITEGNCDVNIGNKSGNTPLHLACRRGHFTVVNFLVNEGKCDVNIRNNSGDTPLRVACMRDKFEVAWYLIKDQRCSVKLQFSPARALMDWAHRNDVLQHLNSEQLHYIILEKDDAEAMLLWASDNGHFNIVKCLITEGNCDVNTGNKSGNTPLHLACRRGDLDIIKWLVTEGHCNVNIRNKSGDTPLHEACNDGHFNIVKCLITEGNGDVNIGNKSGNTPLHLACRRGHFTVVNFLVNEGKCDVNIRNNSGDTPLRVACMRDKFEVAWYLIKDQRCSVKLQFSPARALMDWAHRNDVLQHLNSEQLHYIILEKDDAEAMLLWASDNGHFNIVKCLITEGNCDVNTGNKSGNTPLHLTCRRGDLDIIKWLVTEGHCNVNIRNKSGDTPLHEACNNGNFNIVKCLITEGNGDVNIGNKFGNTPLHLACRRGDLDIVKSLITEGHCNVNIRNKSGDTPLHDACLCDCAQIVHYLLSEQLYTIKKGDRTLLNLTDDPSTIRELLRHGANPENVYEEYSSHLPKHSPKQPPEPAVKILTVGDHGAGKSTLVKALRKERSGLSRIAGRLKRVKGVDEETAGIIPHKLESRFFGHVALYDFAGHKEFYASHAAMIRQSMAGSSTAIFLLLADLRNSDEEFEGSIMSWLSFIDNQCPLDPKPHILIVGSHADEVESKDQVAKSNIADSLKDKVAFANLEFKGYIAINCCYSQSTSISELRQKLMESCQAIRLKSKLSFNTHCFSIYLLDKFGDHEAVKVREVLISVSENSTLAITETDHAKLLSFIPTDAQRLCEMCEDLHDRGSILLLRNTERPKESWIVLDQTALLTTVLGKVFAPKGFKEYQYLASTTGVVPFRKFRDDFPSLDPDMVAQFLCHLEFCQEVTDDEVLQLLLPLPINCEERVFFFPSLVSIDAPGFEDPTAQISTHTSPTQIWKPSCDFVYSSGWVLQCSQAEHHFTPRFLQVLLLRLAFCFVIAPHIQEIKSDLKEVQREFHVWKRGICWVTRNGVGALVEMDQSGKMVTVLLRCLERSKVKCIHLRSAIIHKALCAREEFCSKVSTSEYFIHPNAIEYPLKPTPELNLLSISQITRAVAAGDSCVIGKDSLPLDLETLLYFEPYCNLNATIIQELFDEEKASHDIDGELMHQIAKYFCNKQEHLFRMLKLPDSTAMEEALPSSAKAIVRLLQLWYLRSRKGSYQCLHRELDHFSVFAGRNPLSPTSSSLSGQSAAENASEVDSTNDNYSINSDSVDETTLGIESLLEVRTKLREASLAWFDIGLALGLHQHTLESLQNGDGIGHCLTETLAAWLQGRDGAAAPTWRAIVKALLNPTINFYKLALKISKAHQCSDRSSSSMTSEDPALQDVDNARLEDSSLMDLKQALLARGRYLAWFELGLALGLFYGTLKFIQSEYSNDNKCLTETLAAWLKQKDRVPKQGVPSWNSLTRALAHPLVSQQGLAQEIATKHLKVNRSDEKRSTSGKGDSDSNQTSPDESSSYSDTLPQCNEDRTSSSCFRRSGDPETVNLIQPLEQVSKDHESTCAQTDIIHAPPEEMATTVTKIPVVLSSVPPTHTLTPPPPPSEHTVTASVIRNEQEIARTQDSDTSETQDVLCPIVKSHLSSDNEDGGHSSCSQRSSDPLTANMVQQFERVSKALESTCAQTDTIHTPPEEMATAATKIPVIFSSAPPTHTLTSPLPLSERTMISVIIGNKQEIAKRKDPDTSATQDVLCPIVEPHFKSNEDGGSSSCSHTSSDPLTTNVTRQLEQVCKDHKSTCAETDTIHIHTPPEEVLTTALKEIAGIQDPDTSATQDVLCPVVEPHFNNDDEDTGSSSCSHGSSDPLTVNVTHQLEQVSKDHEFTCAPTDTIHTPPEELVTAATKIPVELSSVPPTHTLTSPPPSEHTVIAGIIRNQQEIAKRKDPDTSATQDVLCPIVEPHFKSNEDGGSSSCSHRSSDPLTTNVTRQLEQVCKDHKSTCAETDTIHIHTPPEEVLTTALKEIAGTQDPDTSATQDVLCPVVEPHFNNDDEDTGSSSCSHGSSDPLTVNVTHQLEQVSKDHESTCAPTDTIHTPPEEIVTAATKIPVELSSVPPTHTLTSPPPSEHTVIAGIIRNQQEIARTQDPDPSNFETQVL